MLKKNDVVDIAIEDLTVEGAGIGRYNGLTVFVPKALPGERVSAKIIKTAKNYAVGRLDTIKQVSEQRTEPFCGVFNQCGGCTLQHMAYAAQLAFKRKRVMDCFSRIGGMDADVAPVLGMENPWEYRNKAAYPVRRGPDGEIAIGFFAPRSHRVADIQNCGIQHPVAGRVVDAVRHWMENEGIVPYDERDGTGIIRHLMVRVGYGTGEVQVTVVINGEGLPASENLVKALRDAAPGLVSVVQNSNTRRDNVIMGDRNVVLWGREWFEDILDGLRFRVGPMSFYQVNPAQTAVLYREAIGRAGLTGNETVADAYCGIGTISLFAARNAKKVIGVESVCEAVENAKENAALNNIANAEFVCAAAEEWLPGAVREGLRPDVILLDPPRKGCDTRLLDAILAAKPERVVYVSCDPATLARDVKRLTEGGLYGVEGAVQPVDMFPQTGHVETVVLMTKCGSEGK